MENKQLISIIIPGFFEGVMNDMFDALNFNFDVPLMDEIKKLQDIAKIQLPQNRESVEVVNITDESNDSTNKNEKNNQEPSITSINTTTFNTEDQNNEITQDDIELDDLSDSEEDKEVLLSSDKERSSYTSNYSNKLSSQYDNNLTLNLEVQDDTNFSKKSTFQNEILRTKTDSLSSSVSEENTKSQRIVNNDSEDVRGNRSHDKINYLERESNNYVEKSKTNKSRDKITLNVGGKKFNLKKSILKKFSINYKKLQKVVKNGRTIYFLDRDPYYFSKIIDLVKIYGFNCDKFVSKIENFSDQLVGELCFYGLLDKKFRPSPRLKLKKTVTFPSRYSDIIKIVANNQLFEVLSTTLSRSDYFNDKLKTNKSNIFYLTEVDPKIFRYVLNFLRTGELFVYNDEIICLLNNYGIEYEKIEKIRITNDIISHYVQHNLEPVYNQIINLSMFVNSKDRYFSYSDNMLSFGVENINVITTSSELKFDSKIVFNLTDPRLGEYISDLILCIDIPVLKPTEPYQYVEMVEYHLVNNILLMDNEQNVLMQTNNEALYLYPLIYTDKGKDYHELTFLENKKVLYGNDLVDVHRVILPLFLFNKNYLPVEKLFNMKRQVFLVVSMSPLNNIFKDKIKEIPLLNIFLISNFLNFPKSVLIRKNDDIVKNPSKLASTQKPSIYIYDRLHVLTIPIQIGEHPIYNVVTIPLEKFGLIKDFYFTIVRKEDLIYNKIGVYVEELVELEIFQVKNGHFLLHSKMDSVMLNRYIPLKKLGHRLPHGIYYYSMCIDPKSNQFSGGLSGNGFLLRLKVKKMEGVVKFYVNEYYPYHL
ncbi:MAG: hypothetical protein QXW79_00400 [Thermoplasmata archaeon]